MRQIDRGLYSKDSNQAYNDNPHQIGLGQTISAPHMHAKCLELLEDRVSEGSRVLDVGSGSGYLSACFALMVGKTGKVIGIERHKQLLEWSIENVKKEHSYLLESGRLVLKVGDGWKGEEEYGPFDAIHVGAAAESVPSSLVDQLRPGGRLVIPVGKYDQYLVQVDKSLNSTVTQKNILGVRYVPLVKDL